MLKAPHRPPFSLPARFSQPLWSLAGLGLGVGLAFSVLQAAHAVEGPPLVNGVIANPTLVENQAIAKAQAAGVITSYMTKGATTCDAKGQNCHSLFGGDDKLDYGTTQANSQSLTGVQSFSFQGSDGESSAISSQTAAFVVACGDTSVKTVAGVAFKATGCLVNTAGDAQLTLQVCTAPTRSNPVTQPANAVECSTDPAAPNFRAPFGKVCIRPACDTEPVNSLNGWSAPQTISWQTSVAQTGTDAEKTKNGLAMVFYPALGAGVPADFKADSDNMTAVKIVQSFVNTATNRTAVGVKLAYRHKATVTKDMMIQGASSVPNPGAQSGQWDTILKLQGNALIPQYQEKYAKNGTECLQQIQGGIANDGKISVCDQNYSNESGVRPMALTAQVAAEGQDCGSTAQCLQEVVNTNTWSQTCNADVPLSLRKCTTKTDFTEPVLVYSRTKIEEVCTENRFSATYGCNTSGTVSKLVPRSCYPGTRLVNRASYLGPYWDPYALLRVTCLDGNTLHVQWGSSVSGSEFDNAQVYGYTWMSVDVNLAMNPFVSQGWTAAGYVCLDAYANGVRNLFKIDCGQTSCTYTAYAPPGGSCGWSSLSPSTSGSADIGWDPVYDTVNACAGYEAAR